MVNYDEVGHSSAFNFVHTSTKPTGDKIKFDFVVPSIFTSNLVFEWGADIFAFL